MDKSRLKRRGDPPESPERSWQIIQPESVQSQQRNRNEAENAKTPSSVLFQQNQSDDAKITPVFGATCWNNHVQEFFSYFWSHFRVFLWNLQLLTISTECLRVNLRLILSFGNAVPALCANVTQIIFNQINMLLSWCRKEASTPAWRGSFFWNTSQQICKQWLWLM